MVPTYRTKWGSEATWAAVIVALSSLAFTLGETFEWDPKLVTATVATVSALARLLIGALLPEPAAAGDGGAV